METCTQQSIPHPPPSLPSSQINLRPHSKMQQPKKPTVNTPVHTLRKQQPDKEELLKKESFAPTHWRGRQKARGIDAGSV